MVRELRFRRSGRLGWHERAEPVIEGAGDVLVRPFLAGRCDGDALPIHRPVSRALQAGMALGLVDPVVGSIPPPRATTSPTPGAPSSPASPLAKGVRCWSSAAVRRASACTRPVSPQRTVPPPSTTSTTTRSGGRSPERDAAPAAYATRTTELVLARTPLDPENGR
ncbi:hypothetical protein [Saccharopolyspora gregorii]|uniref:hypothetical protein n=1 Tax=Saccharopolyspora gregorii TaxID=33914 RepID=UPI0031ED471B